MTQLPLSGRVSASLPPKGLFRDILTQAYRRLCQLRKLHTKDASLRRLLSDDKAVAHRDLAYIVAVVDHDATTQKNGIIAHIRKAIKRQGAKACISQAAPVKICAYCRIMSWQISGFLRVCQ